MRIRRIAQALIAAFAVLAIVLFIGVQLNERQQGVAAPSPTATPSQRATTAPSATPTPASTIVASYNDDFGFVLTEPGAGRTTLIRLESGSRLPTSFDQEHFALSPDGRKIAYFTPAASGTQQLRLIGAGDAGRPAVLRTLGTNELGGAIVWANDASGLLYQTYSLEPAPTPPSPPGNPSLYVVHTFDLRATQTPERVVQTSPIRGLVLLPIAWDRAAGLAAVVETGEGGFMGSYDVLRLDAPDVVVTKAQAQGPAVLAFSMSASSDAKLVLAATFENGGSLSWWPLADFGARKTITGARAGFWRPQTHEVATVGGCAGDPVCGPNGGVRLLDVEKGTSHIVYGFTVANMNVRLFRADGSALLVYAPQAPGANMYDYTLVPLSGAPPVTFKDVNGLLASVRLR